MRICYPINDEEPTPALPKGGNLNEAQYSLTTNRLSLPSLGEGSGVGSHSPLPWRLLRRVWRIKNPDTRLRRIAYPPELLLAPNRRYPPSLGERLRASLGERLRVGELRSGMRPGVGVRRLALSPLPWGGSGVGVSYAPKGH